MNEIYEKAEVPKLHRLPSAQAHGRAAISGRAHPPVSAKKRSGLRLLGRVAFSLISIAIVGVIGLGILLSRGPVSSERVHAQIEAQLSGLLGDRHSARIDNTQLALGKNGLIALDATNVAIFKDENINLGMAREVAVKVKAVPLLSGKVVAESVIMRGAKLSLSSFLSKDEDSEWPRHVDFTALLNNLGQSLNLLEESLVSAGLDSINLEDADLLGFGDLGLVPSSARVENLRLERNVNFQDGLFFSALLKTDVRDWRLNGDWRGRQGQEKTLTATISGLDLADILAGDNSVANGTMGVRIVAPFAADGTPKQAIMNLLLEDARFDIEDERLADLSLGALNFRILTEKNQIELERSPVKFSSTEAVLLGGLRFPKTAADAETAKPIFQIIANDVTAFGLDVGERPQLASLNAEGWLEPADKTVQFDSLLMNTPSGALNGSGSINFAGDKPHYKVGLKIPKMDVTDFKAFWPTFLAPGARQWADDGITGGRIENATLDIDMPPGLFGNAEKYTPDNLSARVPLIDGVLKSPGDLPPISSAEGVVTFGGSRTTVDLSSGSLNLGKRGVVGLSNSTLKIGSYTNYPLPSTLNLKLKGKAQAVAALGTIEPFKFSKDLNINPTDLSGSVSADVTASLNLREVKSKGVKDWKATVNMAEASSRTPFQGRKVADANLAISAQPGRVEVKGTATLDGVPAKVAIVQGAGGSRAVESRVVLSVDDRMRKKIIGDTGNIITGPIDVIVSRKGSTDSIEADLRNARLNFPWIGWSKGKGIAAKATFDVSEKNGVKKLENFQLSGNGFSAGGRLELDKQGLAKAALRKVRLNKTDDFDVDVTRTKGGYSINLNARSYDGRALIKTFLASERAGTKGGLSVRVVGSVGRLYGFGGEYLDNVKLDFSQRGSRVANAIVDARTASGASVSFALTPVNGGLQSKIQTRDAGALLRFTDTYSKVRGGTLSVDLVQDSKGVFRGPIEAKNFTLLNEPRLAQLLNRPSAPTTLENGEQIVRSLKKIDSKNVKVDNLLAKIVKGKGFLTLEKGRLTGGDASAAFDGRVYDQNNRMNIKGTFLPGRALNQLVSKIPILGLAFGKGKVNGLLGITFKLSGRFDKPTIQVNPLSVFAPGVFREIFKF